MKCIATFRVGTYIATYLYLYPHCVYFGTPKFVCKNNRSKNRGTNINNKGMQDMKRHNKEVREKEEGTRRMQSKYSITDTWPPKQVLFRLHCYEGTGRVSSGSIDRETMEFEIKRNRNRTYGLTWNGSTQHPTKDVHSIGMGARRRPVYQAITRTPDDPMVIVCN